MACRMPHEHFHDAVMLSWCRLAAFGADILVGTSEGQGGRWRIHISSPPLVQTFWWAYQRAKAAGGVLIMRNEDLDQGRAKPEFVSAFLEDLRCEDLGNGPLMP